MDLDRLAGSITVLCHSSIRITGERTVYADPFRVEGEPRDGELILITHSHYDHFSPEDIGKAAAPGAVIAVPRELREKAAELGFAPEKIIPLAPGEKAAPLGLSLETVASYNTNKPNHPKEKGWLGYILTMGGARYYIAGDTDVTPEGKAVRCDAALVPVGGTYTVDCREAAELVNAIHPALAVPTHYGAIVGTREDAGTFLSLLDPGIRGVIRMEGAEQ